MAIRYVKDFEFPSAAGYSQSTPSKVTGQMLAKGGPAKAPKAPGLMVMIGIPKKPVEKAKGGKVAKVMHEYKSGELHSGSKKGPKVTNPKQAIAIALSEQRAAKKAKGGMAHEDVAEDKSLIKSMVKPAALKKADGGGIDMASPLAQMAARQRMARAVPVAPRAPVIAAPAAAMQAAPNGGPRIGVNAPRPGGPNVGAIRAAMARRASQAMPENAPSMMKKGGKVKC